MKKSYSISLITLVAIIVGLFIWQYAREEAYQVVERASGTLPSHCSDEIYNNSETGIDCGWICSKECTFTTPEELLQEDITWSGNILVKGYLEVPEGVTLTIEPGTIVKFQYDRDYKTFNRSALEVKGGLVKAIGTADEMIWFTSSASLPQNGDWMGISLTNSESVFDHVIVEYGEMGIEQFDSATEVTNSIIRWANAEGLYAERSTPVFTNNTLYGNGYHEIALEQYNEEVQIKNNYFRDGHFAIHNEKTTSLIEDNYFKNYSEETITAGMESDVTIKGNTFENIPQLTAIEIYGNSTSEISDNKFVEKGTPPTFDYKDQKNFTISYIPGDKEDKFPYVYAEIDKTRKVVKKIGKDLSFGWSLLYANDSLWRFSLGSGEIGEELDFIKIDPQSGDYQKYGNNEIINPRGLTWDGEYFWVNDFSLLKIYKFQLEGDFIKIIRSYDIPNKDEGGCSGLTSDDDYLYLINRDRSRLYKISKTGKYLGDVTFTDSEEIGSTIVWTGEYFWTNGGCAKGLCKWTKDGQRAGEIYPAAKDTWALAWDGKYLWTIQRTSELWNDAKIYQIKIIDDSLPSTPLSEPQE